jgi:hypothetical protein
MPVVATNAFSGPFTPNGATVAFPFTFEAASADEVTVHRELDGFWSVVSPALYTVSLTGTAPSPGTVTFGVAPATDSGLLYIASDPDFTQDIAFTNNGAFLPAVHDEANDRADVRDIYLRGLLDRALLLPLGDTAPPLPSIEPDSVLLSNDLGTSLSWGAAADFQGPTGAPGGNVESIGLFTNAAGSDIPAGTDRVRTSGWHTVGLGAADYYYSASVDATYVSTYPRFAFLAADGRGFVVDPFYLNPKQAGCFADGATDDGEPLQAYFDYVFVKGRVVADVEGAYNSSIPIVYGDGVNSGMIGIWKGRFYLRMIGSGQVGFTFAENSFSFGLWENLWVNGLGGDNSIHPAADMTWEVGVAFRGGGRNKFIGMRAAQFAYAGIEAGSGNNTFNHYGQCRFSNCGSGHRSSNTSSSATKYGITTEVSNPVETGSASSTGQRTTLDATVMPPDFILNGTYGTLGDRPYMIRIPNTDGSHDLYNLTDADSGAGTIEIAGWLNPDVDFAEECEYVYGGGLVLRGGDSNVVGYDGIDATRCGMGISCASLYPPDSSRTVTQLCGIGVGYGTQPGSTVVGGKLSGVYFEGNIDDIAFVSRPQNSSFTFILSSEYALNLDRVKLVSVPRDGAGAPSNGFLGLDNCRISHEGYLHEFEKRPYDTGPSPQTLEIRRPGQYTHLTRDNGTAMIVDLVLDANLHRLFGYSSCLVTVSQVDGTNPTLVTFNKPSGFTLNGGGSAVNFSTFTAGKTPLFLVNYDFVAMNVTVNQLN